MATSIQALQRRKCDGIKKIKVIGITKGKGRDQEKNKKLDKKKANPEVKAKEWFQPQMRKINQWLSQLPVKGTQFTVHVLWSIFSEYIEIYQYEQQKVVLILICFDFY